MLDGLITCVNIFNTFHLFAGLSWSTCLSCANVAMWTLLEDLSTTVLLEKSSGGQLEVLFCLAALLFFHVHALHCAFIPTAVHWLWLSFWGSTSYSNLISFTLSGYYLAPMITYYYLHYLMSMKQTLNEVHNEHGQRFGCQNWFLHVFVVSGMLPHKTVRGQAASHSLKCYEGIPPPYDKRKRVVVPGALRVMCLKPGRKVMIHFGLPLNSCLWFMQWNSIAPMILYYLHYLTLMKHSLNEAQCCI